MYNIIVNEKSGKKRGERVLNVVKEQLEVKGIDYKVFSTDKKGDAEDFTRELTSGTDEVGIIAIGGDGTFHEILNGIQDFEKITLGFIPSGRGNDFARAAGLKKKTVAALDNILKNEVKRIDYIEVGGRRTLNILGTGLDIEVLERVIRSGANGKLNYIFALIASLRKFDPYKIKMEINGVMLEREVILITACNGTCIGGGIQISPLSSVDDGEMDVVIINNVRKLQIPLIFAEFLKGKHIRPKLKSYAEHYKCKSVKVENTSLAKVQMDGEIYEQNTFEAKLITSGLKVVGL